MSFFFFFNNCKVKKPLWPAIPILITYPTKMSALSSRDMCKNIHGFIHNSLKLETTQMFISSRMDQSALFYSHKTILYSTKEE